MKRKFLYILFTFFSAYSISHAQNIPTSLYPIIPGSVTHLVTPPAAYSGFSLYNYTRTMEPQSPVSDAASLSWASTFLHRKVSTVYTNGWGQEMQRIDRFYSQTKDLVTPYDNRPSPNKVTYLPYPVATTSPHAFRNTPFTEQSSYYGSQYPDEEGNNTAISETAYTSDADGRYLTTYNAGKSNVGQLHGTSTSNGTNITNEVIIWEIDPGSGYPVKTGFYAVGTLVKKVISNADGRYAAEYYDNEGKLICKRILSEVVTCGSTSTTSPSPAGMPYAPDSTGLVDSGSNYQGDSLMQNNNGGNTSGDSLNANNPGSSGNEQGDPNDPGPQGRPYADENGNVDPQVAMDNENSETALRMLSGGIWDKVIDAIRLSDPAYPNNIGLTAGGQEPIVLVPAAKCPTYLMTYYVYDVYDRHVYTLPPKAVYYLKANSWVATPVIINNLCDYDLFDDRGRSVGVHVAGENGITEIVYDRHDRPILEKRPSDVNVWSWTHYDAFGRVIQTGRANISSAGSTIQSWFDNASLPAAENTPSSLLYYLYNEALQGVYINTAIASNEIYTANFYDNYDYTGYFNGATIQSFGGVAFTPSAITGYVQSGTGAMPTPSALVKKTSGKLTYSVSKILKPFPVAMMQDYTWDAHYYDDDGREIQSIGKNERGGFNYLTKQYDFKGRILVTVEQYNNPLATAIHIVTKYDYNAANKTLMSIRQSINGSAERPIVSSTYNDRNQQISKTIGGIEYQRLTYNIRGQLTGINPEYARFGTIEPGKTSTFGEDIRYDGGFTNNLYCGNITGILWKSAGYSRMAYGYKYDLAGRLKQADFRVKPDASLVWGGGAPVSLDLPWNNTDMNYTEGGYLYDLNGNISNLVRYGPIFTSPSPSWGIIDNIGYLYKDAEKSNQIDRANDATGNVVTTGTDYDFKNGLSPAYTDYYYDGNGNMLADRNNKNVDFSYFSNDRPKQLTFPGSSDNIAYCYSVNGQKTAEIKSITTGGVTTNTTTDYIGNVVYENNVAKMVHNQEGYAIPSGTGLDYYVFVRDHLGNVRNLLQQTSYTTSGGPVAIPYGGGGTSIDSTDSVGGDIPFDETTLLANIPATEEVVYLATHEISNAQGEEAMFDNIPFVRAYKPLSQDPSDIYATNLDASDSSRTVGTSLLLKVSATDQLDISALSYFEDAVGNYTHTGVENTISALISSLVTGQGGNPAAEGGHTQLLGNLFTSDNINLYNSLVSNDIDSTIPQGFINYLFFDENFSLVSKECGRIPIAALSGSWSSIGLTDRININTNGYVVVFSGTSTSGWPISIDDVTVTHYKGVLKDVNHYYPYGLAVNLTSHLPTAATPENKYLYQTKKQDKTKQLYIDDFEARQYDPQIGRFLSVDAANQYSSAYTGMGDNPTNLIDPTGNYTSASVWASSGNAPSPFNYAMTWNGFGISGGGPAGITMSKDQIAAGYRAMYSTVAFVGVTLATGALGEIGGAALGGLSRGEAAYVASQMERGAIASTAPREVALSSTSRYAYGSTAARAEAFSQSQAAGFSTPINNISSPTPSTYGATLYEGMGARSSAADLAAGWQGKGSYPGVDAWRNIGLQPGTEIVGGLPGQSNFYTTMSGLNRSGFSATNLFEGLQIRPHAEFGYRTDVGIYQVPTYTPAAMSTTTANPQYGIGGLPQIFIPDFSNLNLLKTIPLK